MWSRWGSAHHLFLKVVWQFCISFPGDYPFSAWHQEPRLFLLPAWTSWGIQMHWSLLFCSLIYKGRSGSTSLECPHCHEDGYWSIQMWPAPPHGLVIQIKSSRLTKQRKRSCGSWKERCSPAPHNLGHKPHLLVYLCGIALPPCSASSNNPTTLFNSI